MTNEEIKKVIELVMSFPPVLTKISMNSETYEFLKKHIHIYDDKTDSFKWIKSNYGSVSYESYGIDVNIDNELPYGTIKRVYLDGTEKIGTLKGEIVND